MQTASSFSLLAIEWEVRIFQIGNPSPRSGHGELDKSTYVYDDHTSHSIDRRRVQLDSLSRVRLPIIKRLDRRSLANQDISGVHTFISLPIGMKLF